MLSALGQDVGRLKETPSIASSGLESLISGSETNPADCLVDLIPNTKGDCDFARYTIQIDL